MSTINKVLTVATVGFAGGGAVSAISPESLPVSFQDIQPGLPLVGIGAAALCLAAGLMRRESNIATQRLEQVGAALPLVDVAVGEE